MNKAQKKLKKIAKLLERACMNIYQWRTGVVLPTPEAEGFRISVGGARDSMWGDCVSISICYEKDAKPGAPWYVSHFSPARARLIAENLIRFAECIEEEWPNSKNIDKPRSDKA